MDDPVRWLFLDLNAYFASVEQQETPALRGQPVAVVPVMADSTCCIAASYEAKAFGVKTGTGVGEAKKLCPKIRLVEARHGLYVRYHHAIVDAVESCVPIHAVLSIDEMICELRGSQRAIPVAMELARKVKKTIYAKVGDCLRSSVGLAPNRFLAKLASDMQKPDGLTVIRSSEVPRILYPLALRDFPGIGRQMERRLREGGIHTVEQLCALSAEQMKSQWGGIVGEHFYDGLRGKDTAEQEIHRQSIGHSHVLPPDQRNRAGAFQIAMKLAGKAAVRLRKDGYYACGLALGVHFVGGGGWEAKQKLFEVQDTPTLLKALESLWNSLPAGKPVWVGVTLHPIVPLHLHTPSLFENPKREKLSAVMDRINERYGRDTAYFGALHPDRDQAPTRIAFNRIPDLSEVEEAP